MFRRPIALTTALVLLVPLSARGNVPAPPGRIVPLFTIAKSSNKNQVQYSVRVDDQCVPAGSAPVFAYWRMLEQGPDRTEPLLDSELPAYGLASQSVESQGARGGKVRIALRGFPHRAIEVETWGDGDGACRGSATLPIGGTLASLYNVYAKLRWPFFIDYLLLQGWSLDGAHLVRETLHE
jgi:hypothetical protein